MAERSHHPRVLWAGAGTACEERCAVVEDLPPSTILFQQNGFHFLYEDWLGLYVNPHEDGWIVDAEAAVPLIFVAGR